MEIPKDTDSPERTAVPKVTIKESLLIATVAPALPEIPVVVTALRS